MMQKIRKIYPTISKIVYLLFIYSLAIILPLYFNDLYFDMMETKASIFLIIIKILLPLILIVLIIKISIKKMDNKILIVLLLSFLICLLISTLLSVDIEGSIYGYNGWYIGLITICFLIVSIITFNDVNINKYYYLPIIVCFSFIYLCGIFHSFEIDLLNLHDNILDVSFHKYLTTIGNINWYTGFLALSVPAFVGLYINEKEKCFKIIFFIVSALGLLSITLLGSDGIFLGFGILSFFIIPYIFKSRENIKCFSLLVIVFGIGLIIARYLDYCMDGYAALLRRRIIIYPILFIGLIMLLTSLLIKEEYFSKVYKKIIIVVEIFLAIVAVMFAIIALNKADAEWGTGRVAIWDDSLTMFSNFTLKRKLFGIGLENLYKIYYPLSERYGGIYLSSHSEWIQLLLTGGLTSSITYLLCWVYVFIRHIKNSINNYIGCIPFTMALICYFGQSIVNSATTCNVALLSLIFILFINNDSI